MLRAFTLLILLGSAAAAAAPGQSLSPPGTGGVALLADALRRLATNTRVLVIGAHPDDEDSRLIALLSRGLGADVAYLSLTRGEGGQNLIGGELGPALGVLRTEELLAARAVDGARQYFTRAYDFGYCRTADEAFRQWPRDSLLRDVLTVIRRVRPQVLVSVFSGTARDGHGHHQAAGILAREAFDVLRDSVWGPVKLYRSTRFDTAAATLHLDAGALDPVAGYSYDQIAMASRSRHRSQDMGQIQRPGPSDVTLALVAARPGVDGGFFAGVDTMPPGWARYAALIDSARAAFGVWRPAAIVPLLARARGALGAEAGTAHRRALLDRALAAAAGLVVDAVVDDDVVTPGQRLQVEVSVWNAGDGVVHVDGVELQAPKGWTVQRLDVAAVPVRPGTLVRRRFVVIVAANAPRTEPYFLRQPSIGALYDWSGVAAERRGMPFEPPLLDVRVRARIGATPVTLSREVVHRVRDEAVGEVRRPLAVSHAFDVAISPDLAVLPVEDATSSRPRFLATVTNRARGAATARLAIAAPPGWDTGPVETIDFTREDETRSIALTLTPPSGLTPGRYAFEAAAVGPDGGNVGAIRTLAYPHVRPRAYAVPSKFEVRAVDIAIPRLTRIGYVRGAADRVPELLRALGLPVELLPADSLGGALGHYDAIVVGSRAYEIDPALPARNGRLLDYARAGGLVIVQYQQYDFARGGFTPYPLTIARPHDRVTDEAAPVTALLPDDPALTWPNALGPEDWRGWVQERGLYFAHDWDSTYRAPLAMSDFDDAPLRGGLLIAPLGRGTYVYTGLSFFRQLPAGVPGAYRLFANLLALGRKDGE